MGVGGYSRGEKVLHTRSIVEKEDENFPLLCLNRVMGNFATSQGDLNSNDFLHAGYLGARPLLSTFKSVKRC